MVAEADRIGVMRRAVGDEPSDMNAAHDLPDCIDFARAVEPDNADLAARQRDCERQRERGEPTVPSTMAVERATNPFLRCDQAPERAAAERRRSGAGSDPVSTFAEIRGWKNEF